MKKVLFLTHRSNFVSHFLNPQIELYKKHGYQVDLATSPDKRSEEIPVDHFYDIGIKQSPFKFISNFKAYRNLVKLIKENHYDVINSHTPVGGVLARLLKMKFKNLEVIYTAHGFHFFKGGPKLNWLLFYPVEKFLSRFTDKLIVINQEDYQALFDHKFKSKKKYLVHGVGIEDLYHNKALTGLPEDGTIRLLSIGQLNKNKNHEFMINSVEQLVKEYPRLKLSILGEGDLKEYLEKLILEKGLSQHVELAGYQTDVYPFILDSHLFVSASYREGLPKSVMEALQVGLPCLVSNTRGNTDLVKTELNGYVMKDFTVEEFITGFKYCVDNYDKLQKNTISSVSKFLLENVLKDYENIYFND